MLWQKMVHAEFSPDSPLCPEDWERQLELTGGMVSFVAMPICTQAGVAGIVTLASRTPDFFGSDRWVWQV